MCPLQGCSQNTVHARARDGHTTFVRSSVQNAKAFGGGGGGGGGGGLGLCRVEEHQHQLAHQCSPNIIGIWEWGICGLMGGAFIT